MTIYYPRQLAPTRPLLAFGVAPLVLALWPLIVLNYWARSMRLWPDQLFWADALILSWGWTIAQWPRL